MTDLSPAPVLHFTGRADIEALEWAWLDVVPAKDWFTDQRLKSLNRALRGQYSADQGEP